MPNVPGVVYTVESLIMNPITSEQPLISERTEFPQAFLIEKV